MRNLIFIFLFLFPAFLLAQKLPDLIPFVKNNKWGYCDSTKQVIIPAKYTSAEPFVNGMALVWDFELKEKFLIDPEGNKISTPYSILSRNENDDFTVTDVAGNYGLMNQQLTVLVKPSYNGIGSLQGNFIVLTTDKGTGIYNVQTQKWVLPMQIGNGGTEHIFGPFFGLSDEAVGYRSVFNAETGKEIFKDVTYAYVLNETSGLILFNDGQSGILNQDGNILFKTKSRLCYPANDDRIGFTSDEKKYGYMNFRGKTVIEPKYDVVFNFIRNRAVVSIDKKFGVIDTSGNWIIQPEYKVLNHWFNDFSEGVLPLNKGDSTYFFDSNGKIINVISEIGSFTGFENHRMCVVNDTKNYAFMNEKGNFITDYKFSGPSKFKGDLAKVVVTNADKSLTVYYIDKYGTEYIFKD